MPAWTDPPTCAQRCSARATGRSSSVTTGKRSRAQVGTLRSQASRAAESIDKVAALAGGLAKGAHLAQDDGPRVEAGEKQKEQYTESDYPDIAHHLH